MQIAVISDIHGFLPALDIFLDEVSREGVEGIIAAGDMVAGPNPVEVLDRLHERNCWMIRGNNENYILRFASGDAPDWWYTSRQFGFVRWNYENIDQETLRFIELLPELRTVHLPGSDAIRVIHGSPSSDSELIYPDQDISNLDQALGAVLEPVAIFGHTHQPWCMQRHGKLALNPGSSSMSFDPTHEHNGSYAMLTWENGRWQAEIRYLDFDPALLRKAFRETGLLEAGGPFAYYWLKSVETKINSLPGFIAFAYQMAKELGFGDSPYVPDNIWDESAKLFEEGLIKTTRGWDTSKSSPNGNKRS